ncbi:hypothetical protein LY11_05200 [Pedobacter cryoconitis]|uniref:Uncharacterized protein n=1 Tax=Pedobacter cryoconitis TaxID=188932 RepID=A0A327RU70_9SPHI|nr:hypothetical protein LY11_05200 [Pedobacter cryoconitis]
MGRKPPQELVSPRKDEVIKKVSRLIVYKTLSGHLFYLKPILAA